MKTNKLLMQLAAGALAVGHPEDGAAHRVADAARQLVVVQQLVAIQIRPSH